MTNEQAIAKLRRQYQWHEQRRKVLAGALRSADVPEQGMIKRHLLDIQRTQNSLLGAECDLRHATGMWE